MSQEDLKNIIAGGEDSRTEFKSVGFHNDRRPVAVTARRCNLAAALGAGVVVCVRVVRIPVGALELY
ncbi:MAG: hypothetical protein R6X17_11615 [Candidatus Competibacteraceae bacterium]